jgi:hypothetical protein
VHSEHTKQVAERLAQSRPKKLATDVFSCALLEKKVSFLQNGQTSFCPFISTGCGSAFLKMLMGLDLWMQF